MVAQKVKPVSRLLQVHNPCLFRRQGQSQTPQQVFQDPVYPLSLPRLPCQDDQIIRIPRKFSQTTVSGLPYHVHHVKVNIR